MRTIFHITGGLGKHIAATSVIDSYKHENTDDEIIVCSAYPGVFERNEGVSESRDLNSLEYFYRDYISGRTDTKIFAQDPYRQQDHIFRRSHLIKTWCDLVGTKQSKSSSLNFNFREVEIAGKRFLGNQKPLCVFQPFGGSVHTLPYNWARDIHPNIAQSIVNMLVQQGYHVLHVCNQYHPVLENCERLDERCTVGTLAAIIHLSTERILIDSSLQHIAAAIGKPSKVIWNVTSPTLFGYDMHANILPKADYSKGHRKSYLYDFEIGGIPAECPFDKYTQMFDEEAIYYAVLSDPLDSSNIHNKA